MLTVDTASTTYSPFVRLALARYQPHALIAAKLSRVVLADFAQLTPERALTVTGSPFEPGVLSVAVSGPAASGPVPLHNGQPVAPRPDVIHADQVHEGPVLSRGPATGSRLVYAETVVIDAAMLARPPYPAATTSV